MREQVVSLEDGRVLKGTVEADEIYVTAGHKGQAPDGGGKGPGSIGSGAGCCP